MESKNDIDKLFKDKLENREFEIKESFLADLEGKLDAQKPKKNNWLFIFLFLAIGAISFLAYYFSGSVPDSDNQELSISEGVTQDSHEETSIQYSTESSSSSENSSFGIETELSISMDPTSDTSENIEKEGLDNRKLDVSGVIGVGNPENKKENSNSPENNASSTAGFSAATTTTTTTTTINNNAVEGSEEETEDSDGSILSETEEGKNTSTTSSSETDSNIKEDEGSLESKTLEEKNDTGSDPENEVAADSSISKINQETEKANTIESDSTLFTEEESLVQIKATDTLSNEQLKDSNLLVSDSIMKDSLVQVDDVTEEQADSTINDVVEDTVTLTNEAPDSNAKKWSASLFLGPSLVNKSIYGSPTADYLAKRSGEETSIISMSYGARVNYYFNEKINVSLGINSVTYGEDVAYSTFYDTSLKDSTYIAYTYTAVQDTNGNWDTLLTPYNVDTTFFDSTAYDYIGKNRFSYLQIPFMIGYKFTFNKVGFNVRLGGSYGVLLKNKGSYATTSLNNIQPADIKKTMINLVASMTFSYQLDKVGLFIEPKYRFNTGSILNDLDVRQKYNTLGCNFGLSIDF